MKKILLTLLSISSIYFAQAQCELFATVATDTLNCNESVTINLEGFSQVFINELFTPTGPSDPNWVSTGGAQYDQPYIPSNQGGGYFWMGPSATTPTNLTTTAFDLSQASNGQICFEMVYADGYSGSYAGGGVPEQPDQYDEGVSLQYNTGSGWVDIVYYAPNGDILPSNPQVTTPGVQSGGGPFEVWTNFCVDIPAGAFTSNTQFQWLQDNNSGSCCDHWGLDDIQIVTADPSYNIYMLNNNALIGSSPATQVVNITSDTSILFLYTNGIDFCGDTVQLYVAPTTADPVTISCNTLGHELTVSGVSPSSNVVWSPALGLDNPNIQTPFANPATNQVYTVTSDCGVASTLVKVVPLFEPSVSASQDSICVGDITVLTATSDQPTFSYTYSWQPVTVSSPTAVSTNAFPSINTTYVLEMVSDSGCLRQDSVAIYVGAVPKTIEYVGDMRICKGDSTQVTVIPTQPTFFDNFEIGANPSIWSNTYNATANTDCGSITGNALHFNGAGARGVQLFPVNAALGGTISFYLIYGSSFTSGSPCADMGYADVMSLQYSINGGVSWINITTYDAYSYDNWTLVQESIPAGAQTANTIFRLHQPINSGNNTDNWAIDDFLLEVNCTGSGCINYSYNWSPNTNISNPNIANPYFYPTTSTYYSVSISPEGFNCSSAADSILIDVDKLNVSVSPKDTFLCEPTPMILDGVIEGFANSCEQDYVLSTIPLNMLTGTPTTIQTGDEFVTSAIPMPFDFEFFCETKSAFKVGSNGFITFANTTSNGCCSGQNIPNPSTPNDLIALMWEDLTTVSSGSITHFVTGTAPNRVQVIQFWNVPHWLSSATVTGQIQLYEYSNIVEIHCQSCQTDNGTSTLGIENATGTKAYSPSGYNAASWSATNQAWRFIPTNSPVNFNFGWTPNIAMSNDSALNTLVTPTSSTEYVLSVYNINNCLFTDTAKVKLYQSAITVSDDVVACKGDSIQLLATGADTYVWTPSTGLNNDSISNPLSGITGDITYTVTFNTNGCEETREVLIDILNLPSASINNGSNPVVFCEGTSTNLFVDNLNGLGWNYSWTGPQTGSGATLSNVTTPGQYTVSYDDGNCVNETSVAVIQSPKPVIDLSSINKVLCCNGADAIVDLNNLVTPSNVVVDKFYVNGINETGNTLIYSALTENGNQLDIYKVVSIDGCISEDTYLNIETNCMNPYFTSPDTVFVGTAETFDLTVNSANTGTLSYDWTTTDNSPNAIVSPNVEDAIVNGNLGAEGTYTASVTVTSDFGNGNICSETASSRDYVVVSLIDPEYPDAFTPNGDGLNDIYKPVVNSLAKVVELRIYNRWGDMVYNLATNSNKEGWDGKWSGKDQPSDVYVYYSKVVHPDGKEYFQEGSVTLIR